MVHGARETNFKLSRNLAIRRLEIDKLQGLSSVDCYLVDEVAINCACQSTPIGAP
jgi:hypothetical protein